MTGRKSEYTDKIGQTICDKIAEGKSVKVISSEMGINPDTVFKWLWRHPSFADKYALAREAQSEIFAQEMMEICDDPLSTSDQINHARLRIDTRKWIASKLKPKKWGDKGITINNNTTDNRQVNVTESALKMLSNDQLAELKRITQASVAKQPLTIDHEPSDE